MGQKYSGTGGVPVLGRTVPVSVGTVRVVTGEVNNLGCGPN